MVRPGTRIKQYLLRWGVKSGKSCDCDKLAKEMDSRGAKEVLDNIDYYVDAMKESSRKWIHSKTGLGVRPPASVLRKLIEWACREDEE